MSKKAQTPDLSTITITFTIDPTLKLNEQGERAMATTIIARRGDVAQIRQLDVTNWKQDLPAEIDQLVRMFLGNTLVLPAFPNMGDAKQVLETSGESYTEDEINSADKEIKEREGYIEAEPNDDQVDDSPERDPDLGQGEGQHEDQYDVAGEEPAGDPDPGGYGQVDEPIEAEEYDPELPPAA